MPWKERKALDERKDFITEYEKGTESVAELCRRYSISRQSGYKWLRRYAADGEAGLREQSRAPRHRPQQMGPKVRDAVLELRQEHPRWGPRKLAACLQRAHPRWKVPAPSSIGELLHREGLTHPRRKRQRTPPFTEPLAHAQAPNQVWCADYKGWFVCRRRNPL